MSLMQQTNLRLPPPLPVKFPSLNLPQPVADSDNRMLQIAENYEEVRFVDPKKLTDIVREYSLPVRISVCDSVYGIGDYFSFFSDDKIDVHFMKESLIASVKLSMGKKMKIPLNADFQVSLVYDSIDAVFDCHRTTSQLMKTNVLPQLVKVEKGCKGGKKTSDLSEGEVLLFLKHSSPKAIECFSLLTGTEKRIHKSSKLLFLTNPSDLKLCLADVEHLDYPLRVYLHPSKKSLEPYFRMPCIIESLSKEQSVLTSFSDDDKSIEDFLEGLKLHEIFTAVPMDFELVPLSRKEKELLSQKSKILYDFFIPSSIKKVIIDLKATGNPWERDVFEMPRCGKEGTNGIKIFPPTTLIAKQDASTKARISLSCQSREIVSSPGKPTHTPLSTESIPVYMNMGGTMKTNNRDYEEIDILPSSSESSLNSSASFSSPHMQQEHQRIICDMKTEERSRSTSTSEVKLERLSKEQVINLLELLRLTKYKETFIREEISGALLQELDEGILENELGMTSKLHRIKLMRVIDGRQSLDELFHNKY